MAALATWAGTASAEIPEAEPGVAWVSLYVGGDRETASRIGPRPGVTFGLFAAEPAVFDPFDGYTDGAAALYRCTSDADGDCNFRVPIGAGGVAEGTRLWLAPLSGPPAAGTTWYANPVWQTAPLIGSPRDQTRHVFQTPGLRGNLVYVSGADDFVSDPAIQTTPEKTPPGFPSDYTRRIASGGTWPLSRVDPDLPARCGLNVAIIADLSSSMVGSVGDLKDAVDSFVDSLRGTPSQAALFTFSTDTPAPNVGQNYALRSVSTTAAANRFKALYAGWTEGTANGYTNWDRALATVASVNVGQSAGQRFDLAVFITDGNPTVYGPGPSGASPSGYTRFREIGNAVASANLLKRSGGTVVGDVLQGGTRILAIGVGGGLDAGADRNLRSISGRTEYDPVANNIAEADFIRVADYDDVADRLHDLLLTSCAPTISVIKQIVPFGGTPATAFTPADPWQFAAVADDPAAVQVTPPVGQTDSNTGGINFDLTFNTGVAGVTVTETLKPAYDLYGATIDDAVQCVNKSDDDAPVPITAAGVTGFHVSVGIQDAVSCVVYNQAPPFDPASIAVDKIWRVVTDQGVADYPDGRQPPDLQSRLSLTGPAGAGATEQSWGIPRPGYMLLSDDSVTISEAMDLRLPGCRFNGATINGPGVSNVDLPATSPSIDVTLQANPLSNPPNENRYTITNRIACESHLTLLKDVQNGPANPLSWTLSALGPGGTLPGPSGLTGVTAEVSPNRVYELAEQLNAPDPALLNYTQVDNRESPTTNPQSTGSMTCEVVPQEPARPRPGNVTGADGNVSVPLGETVVCVAVNRTATLRIVKNVVGGPAAPASFAFLVAPVDPQPAGVPAQTVVGGGAPLFVRPEQRYQVTEVTAAGDYQLTELRCTYGDGATITLPAGADATCTATNIYVPPPAPTPPAVPTPTPVPSPSSARVTVTKRADRNRVRSGQRVSFRIVVRSRGPATARDVRVCDRLPSSLVLVRARGATRRDGQLCWTIATLRAGASRTFTVVARVPSLSRTRIIRNRVRVTGPNVRTVTIDSQRVRLVSVRHAPRYTG